MKVRFSIYILGFIFLFSCSVSQESIESDYSYLYDKTQSLIKPNFKLFHFHQDSSRLYWEINSSDILYSKLGLDTINYAKISFKYKLRTELKNEEIIDSLTSTLVHLGHNNEGKRLITQFTIPTQIGEVYSLELRIRDEFKGFNVVHYLNIDKRDNGNLQYYLVKSDNQVQIKDYVVENTLTTIEKSPVIKSSKFIIESSNQESFKASPPFAMAILNENIYNPETSDTLDFYGDTISLSIDDRISKLSPIETNTQLESIYLFNYYQGFPEITDLKQMLEPIRYISTTNEYNAIINAEDSRKEFEKFWLSLARDKKAAQKMIREYYSRIEITNENFTSIKPGWKTDRGIIYIIYGQPQEIQKTKNFETWYYGEANNILSVRFQFTKHESSWSENDYRIKKDLNYKNNWYNAVDAWRQGRVY